MRITNLFEHDTKGPHHTWSNRQTESMICLRIDRALVNVEWLTNFPHSEIEILGHYVSDHSPLKLNMNTLVLPRKHRRRSTFLNGLTKHPAFLNTVRDY